MEAGGPTADGKKAVLWTSGWTPTFKGETIYLARATGTQADGAPFVKMRPEDLDAGGMETVFPWRESDGDGTTVESHERLSEIAMGVRNPVMLIRIRPVDMTRVVKRKGQESFNFGDLFAFTKVCSHLGCPSSLYEQQTYRILCPCHQSQFDALHFAKPIFGPAARALAQLPITIDKDGYLVANGDFIEPVGPAFWERKTIMSPKLPKPPSLDEIAAAQGDAIDSRYHPVGSGPQTAQQGVPDPLVVPAG